MSMSALEVAVNMDHEELARQVVELTDHVMKLRKALRDKDALITKLQKQVVQRNKDLAFLQGTRVSTPRMH